MKEKAYKAYWWLADNHEWAIRNLSVSIIKFNPKTKEIDDDKKKNTKIEYWIESGKDWNCGREHDIRLDSHGESFDEALLHLARQVKKYYKKV